MIDKKATALINDAAKAEMEAAIELHGEFHSHHEAHSVLKEEIEEVCDEAEKVFSKVRLNEMSQLWSDIKSDELYDNEYSLQHINDIRLKALNLAQECVQVCAMCDKWAKLIKKENEA